MRIKCKECGDLTWNSTELCGACKKGAILEMVKIDATITKSGLEAASCKECGAIAQTMVDGVCNTCLSKKDDNDNINWPKHYNTGKIQPIDFIESINLDFRLANAVKYIARCQHKGNAKRDLEKAIWYIQRFIDKELNDE